MLEIPGAAVGETIEPVGRNVPFCFSIAKLYGPCCIIPLPTPPPDNLIRPPSLAPR